jgi:hypothetical protein
MDEGTLQEKKPEGSQAEEPKAQDWHVPDEEIERGHPET